MMRLAEAAAHDRAAAPAAADPRVHRRVAPTRRTLRAGDLFVALRGERFDGHAFLAAGDARAAPPRRWSTARHQGEFPLPLLVVEDTQARARRARARHWRARFSPAADRDHRQQRQDHGQGDARRDPARACRRRRRCSPPRGNLNNDIGMPLTLLRLRAAHRCCAIEMGMNHAGEIAYLARHRRSRPSRSSTTRSASTSSS